MINVGNYPQPLDRPTFVEGQLVSGYTTVRLRGELQFGGTLAVPSLNDNLVRGLFVNTGANAGTLQLVQTQDIVSGPRTNLGNPMVLVPGGRITQDFTPTVSFLEFTCTGGGPTSIHAQLTSRIEWRELAFSKTDTSYPRSLWAVQSYYNPPGS